MLWKQGAHDCDSRCAYGCEQDHEQKCDHGSYDYDKKTISQAIHTKWAGKTVHFARETDSTNAWIKRLAKEGAGHGTLAVTEFQTAGRGRFDRKWEAPESSSVMMTLLLRPDFEPRYASMLTLVMGLAVAQAVEELGFQASIKWPNDVVLSQKKICGILTEMGMDGAKIGYVLIGVGINVNTGDFPEELQDKATSLFLESKEEQIYDRAQVIALVMKHFEQDYEQFTKTCDLTFLQKDYEKILANLDQPVRILNGKESFEGICRGIDKSGELLVECSEDSICQNKVEFLLDKTGSKGKKIVKVGSGEVSVRGLYSYV